LLYGRSVVRHNPGQVAESRGGLGVRTRLLQALIVLAVLGLTAGDCVKAGESPPARQAGGQVVKTLGEWLAGHEVTDAQIAEGAAKFGQRTEGLDSGVIATARDTTVAERNVAAEAADARAAEQSVDEAAEQKEMLKNACKVLEAVSPDSTPDERRDALLDLVGAPQDESATAKFNGALETADNLASALDEGDTQKAQVILACWWAEN
jgi:hypothetical protein